MLGKRLHKMRIEKKISLRALAEKVGVDFSYISQIEHERRLPSRDVIVRLSEALGADPDEFLVTAGYLPGDVEKILSRDPRRSLLYIREKLAKYGK